MAIRSKFTSLRKLISNTATDKGSNSCTGSDSVSTVLSGKKVIEDISPNDNMFSGNMNKYLYVGETAIKCIRGALDIMNNDTSDIKTILDFGCGYGRVMRTLKAEFPHAQITACDTNKDAIDFCAKTFDATANQSSTDFTSIKFTTPFDLIFVGSLFTHLHNRRRGSII